MPLRRYEFAHAISGFFEFPTENARALLPKPFEPVELHHGSSVLSATVFDFVASEVGAYRELVLSVVVMPLLRPGGQLPKSALYPYLLATNTQASREHAIETWHLPHWMEDADITVDRKDGLITSSISVKGMPVADLAVAEHSWKPVSHLYQSFMREGDERFVADIVMEGSQSEHEDEAGSLKLYDHPMHGSISRADVSDVPFREVWMRDGLQTFQDLARLSQA
jgi:hypothetical protein